MRLYSSREASDLFAGAGRGPTIFIECTETFVSGRNTGIQRVVRNIAKHAGKVGAQRGINVITVTLVGDKLAYVDLSAPNAVAPTPEPETPHPSRTSLWRTFQSILCKAVPSPRFRRFVYAPRDRIGLALMISNPRRFIYLAAARASLAPPQAHASHKTLDDIDDFSNCVLLLLDADWHLPIKEPIRKLKERGGTIISVVYDLIPITHPQTCEPALVTSFINWTNYILGECKQFIAISKASAAALTKFAKGNGITLPPVGHFYLGSELDLIDHDQSGSEIKWIFDSPEPSFIIVGSIEPRKNHSYALDAFEKYWDSGGAGSLVIIGKYGWMNEDIINRIITHPEFGERLFLLRNASDSDLDYAYKSASALVLPSVAEGFGLPIVEAFQRGLPVYCSDIPVFREVSEGQATLFDLDDPGDLANKLLEFKQTGPTSSKWITWEDSARQLIDRVSERAWPIERISQ